MTGERAFSLSRSLPSALSADNVPSLFECFIGTMPRCYSSETNTRAVRPKPSPAALQLTAPQALRGLPVLVHEVSRRAWGLRLRQTEQELALALLLMLPTAHVKDGGVRNDLFDAEDPPRLAPVYASLGPSRYQHKTRG